GPERTPHVRTKRGAAQVHVCLRLDQPHLDASDGTRGDTRVAVFPPAVKTPNVGEVVDDPPADVVTRALVFLPRIAQSNDDFHGLVVTCRGRCASAASEEEAEHERVTWSRRLPQPSSCGSAPVQPPPSQRQP